MANEWSILSPEAATNLVTNPSAETATTGYTIVGGGSLAQSSSAAKRGSYSIKGTLTATANDGVYYGTIALTSGTTYYGSVDILGNDTLTYKAYFATTVPALKGTAGSVVALGTRRRLMVFWTCDSTTTYRVYIVKESAGGDVVYVDGLQVVALAHNTTYIDGDQGDGYIWNGTAHASTSSRASWVRSAGQEYFLDTMGFRVQILDGIGIPPITHHSQSYALLPGAQFQGTRTQPRVMTLVIRANSTSVTALHSLRKDLIDLVRPDLVKPEQPFRLRYYGAKNAYAPVEIDCVYDAGLGFDSPPSYRDDTISLRAIAYDPYWYETGYQSAILDANDTITSRYIAARPAALGQWDDVGLSANPATNGTVYAIAVSPVTGKVYVGGDFTHWGNVAGRDYCAVYDPIADTWADVGADDSFNGIVRALTFHPNGTLFIGGEFTNAAGIATADYLCQMPESTGTIAAVVGSISAAVWSIAVDLSGNVYFGGEFVDLTDANGDFISKWNGSAASSLGTGLGAGGVCYAIACADDGSVYVGGSFGAVSGVADTADLAKWSGTAWSSIGVTDGASKVVTALEIAANGDLIAGGAFENIDGNTDCYKIAYYSGASWYGLEGGANDTVQAIVADKMTGMVLACGAFTEIGSITTSDYVAVWNGSTWSHLDINFPSGAAKAIATVAGLYGSTIYIGTSGTGTAYMSGDATVTNSGTAEAYPVFRVKRTGGTSATVKALENSTIGVRLYFDYDLADGETLTVDFRPGHRRVYSSVYGDVWRALLRGSGFSYFSLLPGTNTITCFVDDVGSPTVLATMEWRATHWSVDGVAA